MTIGILVYSLEEQLSAYFVDLNFSSLTPAWLGGDLE